MQRKLFAVFLGLFIGLAGIFMWKEFEVPALSVDYYPSVRKKSNAIRGSLGRVPKGVSGF